MIAALQHCCIALFRLQHCNILYEFQLCIPLVLQVPILLESLAGKSHIIKLASHPDARHYLALSKDGSVYSWGSGDAGALGIGDTK